MPYKSLIVERDVEVKMRDGVILRADVYRPQTTEPLPVLLQRTPYGKGWSFELPMALMAAERGYAVVIQDTRGRWASDGNGRPFVHEKADGYDSVEWAAHQPWAQPAVGMFGGSYVGYTQLAAAAARPPALRAISPTVTFCDPFEVMYSGGAVQLGVGVSWGLGAQAQMAITRHAGSPAEKQALMEQLIGAVDGMARGQTFNRLPLHNMPLIGRDGVAPYLAEDMAHPTPDDHWRRMQVPHASVEIPAFHMGGWYDLFAGITLRDYVAIRRSGNLRQKLLMGPWVHGSFESLAGQVDFGMSASSALVLPFEAMLRWFDHWLRGATNGIDDEPPVRIFVMGINRWRDEPEWPLRRARPMPYYLHSGGAANSLSGDGTLSTEAPGEEAVDSFVYDPRHPVPTRGGGLCCSAAALAAGAYDQREIEARPDVLVYSTPPLERDLEVTGPLSLRLWAATSAPDTDFTAKLVDVGPCGYARNLQDGIVRARYYRLCQHAEPIQAHEVYEYALDLAATSNVFLAGHRIRIEISSSNFPRFDRNPNTGHTPGQDAELRPAVQTILHDAAHPSHIVLPLID